MTQLPTLKLVVLGSKNVGKSAVIVRFLTKRYIGEYRSNSDWLYKQSVLCDNSNTKVEILDISQWPNSESVPTEQIRWGEAFVIIYDICDRLSFTYAQQCLNAIRSNKTPIHAPVVLLGNKRDLEHSRQVDMDEGTQLSVQLNCQFSEVSAAESFAGVSAAFQGLLKEMRVLQVSRNLPRHRKISIATVSKAFGAMFGKHNNKNVAKGRRMSFSL